MAALAPDILLQLGPLPLTNTVLNTILIDALILGGVFALKDKVKKIPGTFQNIVEMVVDIFYNLTESIAGSKNAQKIFPYFFTFFIFILLANWSGLLPGMESIGFYQHGDTHHLVSLNRNLTSDINATLGLALISLFATHMLSIKALGIKQYLGKFFSLNPILLFVGILEIVSEFTKIISLSFRLFGNIFAGEVVLATISSLFAFVAPLPFMLLEIIVGIVQALVFSMLTMVFMSVMMTSHHEEDHAKEVSH